MNQELEIYKHAHLSVDAATLRKHGVLFTHSHCCAEKLSAQIGVHLSKLISADGKESRDIRAIEAVMELVREKIIIRHDPLRSPTHCFEPKPERMYGIAGVCGLSD